MTMRILVIFSTFDGQAGRIATRIGEALARSGEAATVRSLESPEADGDIEKYHAVIVGGAVRYGRHSRALERFARANAGALARRPNAFYSVSLSGGGPGAKPLQARRYVEEFAVRTGWRPDETACFAGALRYSRYNAFIRFLMRLIVGASGGDTDTTRDREYTDWPAVERFATAFAARAANAPPERRASPVATC